MKLISILIKRHMVVETVHLPNGAGCNTLYYTFSVTLHIEKGSNPSRNTSPADNTQSLSHHAHVAEG